MDALSTTHILALPLEVLMHIFSFVNSFDDCLKLAVVCREFNVAVSIASLGLTFASRPVLLSTSNASSVDVEKAAQIMVGRYKSVRKLDLSRCSISARALSNVTSLPSIKILLLGDIRPGEAMTTDWTGSSLSALALSNCKLLHNVSALRALHVLALTNCHLTRAHVVHLQALAHLRSLFLGGCRIDVDALPHLHRFLCSLRRLELVELTFLDAPFISAVVQSLSPNVAVIDLAHRPRRLDVPIQKDLGEFVTSCRYNGLVTPLHLACHHGDAELVSWLLSIGANCRMKDDKGCTALYLAAEAGHAECAALMLKYDRTVVDVKNHNFETPLYIAALKGHRDVVAVLLAHDADVNSRDFTKFTCLHAACINRNHAVSVDIMRMLVAHGAAVSAANCYGTTALHIAARAGFLDAVHLLLASGAALGDKDESGNTAVDEAEAAGKSAVCEVLLARGAVLRKPAGRRRSRSARRTAVIVR